MLFGYIKMTLQEALNVISLNFRPVGKYSQTGLSTSDYYPQLHNKSETLGSGSICHDTVPTSSVPHKKDI